MAKFGEWTMAKDELPNVNKNPASSYESVAVIACTQKKTFPLIFERTYVRGQLVRRWMYVWDRIYDGHDIVAWMHMPKPYRGD